MEKMIKNVMLDSVSVVEYDGKPSFEFTTPKKVEYLATKDGEVVELKGHKFRIWKNKLLWDFSHNIKESGKIKRMLSKNFISDEDVVDMLVEAKVTVFQHKMEEGTPISDPRFEDEKTEVWEKDNVQYELKDIILSNEGLEQLMKLWKKFRGE